MEKHRNFSRLSTFLAGEKLKVEGLATIGKIPYNDFYINTFDNVIATSYGLVKDGDLIKNTTVFELYPNENNENFQKELAQGCSHNSTKIIDKAVVLAHNFDSNYQHFLVETLPRLYLLNLMYNIDIPVIISKSSFVREILSLMFPNIELLVVDDEKPFHVESLAVHMELFTRNLNSFHPTMISSLKLLKETGLSTLGCDEQVRQSLYIGRKLDPNNSGSGRVMKNQNELIELLKACDVEDCYFEKMSIQDKARALHQAKFVVTPIGANIMNLIFAEKVEKVIIISHKSAFGGAKWFVRLLEKMCPMLQEVIVFNDITIESVESNNGNVPYTVDLLRFKQLVDGVF